ncbi:MAG: ParB/RepB/Spo0J family partition protein [Patescibacteria group bacterium]
MAQQYGLGRGLASLIPPKKNDTGTQSDAPASSPQGEERIPVSRPVFSYPDETKSPFETKEEPKEVVPEEPVKSSSGDTHSMEVPIGKIVPNPHQPRLHFDEEKLKELADSIKEHGILQPLVVTEENGQYELIAGERRLQASKRAGLTMVPVIIRKAGEQEKLELAIIENIQRHNLNPIEEAKAYLRLIDEFGLQQDAVGKKMGKSRSAVANTVRLLHLPIEIQRAVAEGKISEGHAKALLSIENPEKQRAVFDLIIKEELTVRETELKVRSISVKSHIRSAAPLHPEILEQAEHLMQVLGTKVKIAPSGKGGKVVIEYYSPEDLKALLSRLEE